ncbi:MAG: TIGR04283 family arsenosugar biosynthesis glycosyltransferase [Gammaproteobacteria bacterium]|nr:TIGR04283 family arsenosugar biosynthesis glycosyltransferase [Gammaproteobacteria bacterium]
MGHAAHGSVNPANDISGPPRTVGVILPVLNEAGILETALIGVLEQAPDEIVVVDGGSQDATCDVVRNHPRIRLLETERGRAAQMNAGAAEARSDILLFLHADTRLPPQALSHVRAAIRAGHLWGRFDVRLDSARPAYRIIERFMNLRSALTGIATGDQAIFVRRDVFRQLGGFAPIPLMEDVELSARLRRGRPPARLRAPVLVSVRRWERHGVARTVLRMWWLRLCYWLGVSPARLARWYA